jgi:hypothetical protein
MTDFIGSIKRRVMKNKTTAQMNLQKKKKAVSGTMKGKQVDTTGGMAKTMAKKKTTTKKPTRAAGSSGYKPTNTKVGPNMSRGTKAKKTMDANKTSPATKKRMADKKAAQKKVNKRRGPSGPTMTGFGR